MSPGKPAMTSRKTQVLGSITVIDTPLVTRAMDYARTHSEPFLFNHAVRSWLFAVRLGQLQSIAHDAEVVAIGTLLHDLGLTNTFAGLILPGALFSAFGIFFLRQFMLGLSNEVEQAARIDGLGPFGLLFRITIPMTSGPLITLALLTFINAWNDYFWPLLIANGPGVRPLTVALGVFEQASPQTQQDFAGLMAAALVAALPMLLIFVIFGKRIVNSIGFTGIK